ncbi:hypothetical protein MJO28_010081 [Puccinia striiformis f. sp. tritici]|uniref:Uncharacterized protein n=3 Tax=Puccinia striiformis TaxID=27350 RepID=A0A0L0UQB7_9BASI|nr:hypothetical protein Pst134EB_017999 [Puccinia striiformis f. sp. tritici]KAI7948173.1 hypothetical protein MJO28_010081 [Puccinia striiformis f. sp. tritici]KAI9622307.1 hypothetical protein H4Q26_015345 [Puccinia striiformis f. sp. tritici PST-130]KNE89170.1 hypothetical protein PSTG_17370 [Puccinia striiformis f. sp. tritici PST-78]POW11923.1 hypothetical protein PSTT_04984 [Puccinia striiformis]
MYFSGAALQCYLDYVYDFFVEHRFVTGSMLLGFTILAFLSISHYIVTWYPPFKPIRDESTLEAQEVLVLPASPQINFWSNSKNFGIFDSLIAFSQPGPSHLEPKDYSSMARIFSSTRTSSESEKHLISALRNTGDLTRRLNNNFDELAVQGFNAMLIFAFQENEKLHSFTKALVNWQDEKDSYTCTQTNLTILAHLIQSATVLTEELMQQINTLIEALNRSINDINQEKNRTSRQKRTLARVFSSCAPGPVGLGALEKPARMICDKRPFH